MRTPHPELARAEELHERARAATEDIRRLHRERWVTALCATTLRRGWTSGGGPLV